jgi:hypothetical protein
MTLLGTELEGEIREKKRKIGEEVFGISDPIGFRFRVSLKLQLVSTE